MVSTVYHSTEKEEKLKGYLCDHVETVVEGTTYVLMEHNLTSPHADDDIPLGPYHESTEVPVCDYGS